MNLLKKQRSNPWDKPEYREHMSRVHMGHKGFWTGKKLSDEHRKKLSEAHIKNPQRYWLGKRGFVGKENPAYKHGGHIKYRKIVEDYLGYKLPHNWVVHHWDANRANNDISNFGIFRTGRAHLSFHRFVRRNNLKMSEQRFETLDRYRVCTA